MAYLTSVLGNGSTPIRGRRPHRRSIIPSTSVGLRRNSGNDGWFVAGVVMWRDVHHVDVNRVWNCLWRSRDRLDHPMDGGISEGDHVTRTTDADWPTHARTCPTPRIYQCLQLRRRARATLRCTRSATRRFSWRDNQCRDAGFIKCIHESETNSHQNANRLNPQDTTDCMRAAWQTERMMEIVSWWQHCKRSVTLQRTN